MRSASTRREFLQDASPSPLAAATGLGCVGAAQPRDGDEAEAQPQRVFVQRAAPELSERSNSGDELVRVGRLLRTTLTGSLGSNSPLARLINISSRAQVGSGDDVLIPGFVVSGGDMQLLEQAIGPTLASFNVSGALADSQLTLFNATNQPVGTNDNWGANANAATIARVAQQVSAFALANASKDAALHVTLSPGLYTAVMRGVGDATGVGWSRCTRSAARPMPDGPRTCRCARGSARATTFSFPASSSAAAMRAPC
jgi:hypothetical protein